MPDASCRTMPALSINRWDTISASLGVSRRMGKKYLESRMGSALDSHWGLRHGEIGSPCKAQDHQAIQRVFLCRRTRSAPLIDHGAVHDNPDDKLELFKYESLTRNKAAGSARLASVGRVWSRSEGGATGGATNRGHSKKIIGGDRRMLEKNLKQGGGPALFFCAACTRNSCNTDEEAALRGLFIRD